MIGLLLPTNNPNVYFEKFGSTIQHLKEAKDDVILSVNFQSPWTKRLIRKARKEWDKLGLKYTYQLNSYEIPHRGAVPFNKIRFDCAQPIKDMVEVFALFDDDFLLEEGIGQMFRNILDNFRDDSELGVMECRKRTFSLPILLKKVLKQEISEITPTNPYHVFYTDDGFFFRNTTKEKGYTVFPQDALGLIGAGEEIIIGLELTKCGYSTYMRYGSKITHARNTVDHQLYGVWNDIEITCSKLGIRTYVQNQYKELLKEKEEKYEIDR